MPSNRRGPDGLTDFERDICHAVDHGMTDQDAYRTVRPQAKASDITARNYVCTIRHRPHCIAYLAMLKTKSLSRHQDRKDQIIEELALVAFSDLGDLLSWGPDGLTVKRLDEVPPAQRRALARLTISKSARGGTIRLAMHDKLSALDKLCKLFGLYAQDSADSAEAPTDTMSEVERVQRLTAILRAGQKGDAARDGAADGPV